MGSNTWYIASSVTLIPKKSNAKKAVQPGDLTKGQTTRE
jgi:hypothetical protein